MKKYKTTIAHNSKNGLDYYFVLQPNGRVYAEVLLWNSRGELDPICSAFSGDKLNQLLDKDFVG